MPARIASLATACVALVCALFSGAAVRADAPAGPRASDHAPIGVMGDHMHERGEFMLSYRYSRMQMNGNRDDTGRRSLRSVLRDFPVAPYDMDMEMHMFGGMWAPHDRVTLMAMVPITRLDMKHRTRTGQRFTTRANGLGDITLTALVRLLETEHHHVHVNAGLSVPTGTISARDDTPLGRVRLPYPMQLGSGTWDLLPGLTYTGRSGAWTLGAQLRGTLRTGLNGKGYRWGHRVGSSGWLGYDVAPWLTASLRLDYAQWRGIRGDDDDQRPLLVPTADPNRRAGERLELLFGLQALVTGGPLRGHRLALEIGRPVYQDLDGPQLEQDWRMTAGWQLAF